MMPRADSPTTADESDRPVAEATGEPRSAGRQLIATLRPGLIIVIAMTLVTGALYPLAIIGMGQALFARQASGSLIRRDGIVIGSELIGQAFAGPGHFWGRPSATTPTPYNAAASAGSNLGPANPALRTSVEERIAALRAADPANLSPIPVDLVTASGSGLDPDISLAGARYQVPRVARARGLPAASVAALVERQALGRQFGILGEPRVNVLALNRALDTLAPGADVAP